MIHFHYLPGNGTVRLSEATRRLAERYLESDEIAKTAIGENFSFVPDPARGVFANYAENIRLIAEHAPLRILPEEKLVGAATYRSAVWHGTPGHVYNGISHTTVHFEKGIRLGLSGLEREVRESMRRPGRTSGELEFLESMLTCIEAMRIWHRRYQAELKRMAGMEEISSVLEKVPEGGAETFREAVQSLAFFYEFCRLCGNWSGLGRLDRMLRGYLEQDLRANRITLEEARELLAHFWIKGTEWKGLQKGSGDAQHYQNVILGGIDASGRDVTNPVTHLILDIVEELHISDFPIAVRVNGQTSDAMFARIAEIQRRGGGIVSIYNESVVLKALEKFGYPYEEAVEFTNDGCWEVIIPGRTFFGYRPFDALRIFQEFLFRSPESSSFEDFYGLYLEELRAYIRNLDSKIASAFSRGEGNFGTPGSLLSLFVENCIGSARNYGAGGPVYTAIATHAGGLPDVANELFLLKKLVFEEKRLRFGGGGRGAEASGGGLCRDCRRDAEIRRSAPSGRNQHVRAGAGVRIRQKGDSFRTFCGRGAGSESCAVSGERSGGTDRRSEIVLQSGFYENTERVSAGSEVSRLCSERDGRCREAGGSAENVYCAGRILSAGGCGGS